MFVHEVTHVVCVTSASRHGCEACFRIDAASTLEQVVAHRAGAAMCGFTSPCCAQCVAALAEYHCMAMLIASQCMFATRYMDDAFVTLNVSQLRSLRESLAAVCRHALFHMYDAVGFEVGLESLWLLWSCWQSTLHGYHCVLQLSAGFGTTGHSC